MNTHQVAFVVYKTPGQKHCWTDLLHCPFQRWNPRDQILDPICKTGKQINSDVPSSCFPAAFPVQGSWGKKRTQILTWFMWCSPGKLSSNRGSTGHSWLKLLDTPGAAEDLHWTPALLLLEFGAVLSHHFLPPVTASAALCTTVNWTQGHHKAEARICSTPLSASEQENQDMNLQLRRNPNLSGTRAEHGTTTRSPALVCGSSCTVWHFEPTPEIPTKWLSTLQW